MEDVGVGESLREEMGHSFENWISMHQPLAVSEKMVLLKCVCSVWQICRLEDRLEARLDLPAEKPLEGMIATSELSRFKGQNRSIHQTANQVSEPHSITNR